MASEVKASGRSSYHHGDLPAVLTRTAVDLIAEHGVHGFSLAEAARRAGVSPAAPYRHFPDKESLLAAVGVQAYAALRPRLDAAIAAGRGPVDKLARAAGAYVRFAAEEPALFSTLFGAGLDKARFPELRTASLEAYETWLGVARRLVGSGSARRRDAEARATDLSVDVLTIAHGHAALLADGQFGPSSASAHDVETRTWRVVRTYLSQIVEGSEPAQR